MDWKIGFKKLELLCNEDADNIIVTLIDPRSGFSFLLETDLSNDYIVLIVMVLSKMCSSVFEANKAAIMNLASTSKFIKQLTSFILELPLQNAQDRRRSGYFWKDQVGFWKNVIGLCESLIQTIPFRACEVLEMLIKAAIQIVKMLNTEKATEQSYQELNYFPDLLSAFNKLQNKFNLCVEECERKKKVIDQGEVTDQEEPPDDFRLLSVYPSSAELKSNTSIYLRPNIVKGSFGSVNKYLDIQFRLLREDFVAPLRQAISTLLTWDQMNSKKISNVKIYRDVKFLFPTSVNDKTGILVQFQDQSKKTQQKSNYLHTKRFMFGALVVFTNDNFETFFFGKVIERDVKLLEEGKVVSFTLFYLMSEMCCIVATQVNNLDLCF